MLDRPDVGGRPELDARGVAADVVVPADEAAQPLRQRFDEASATRMGGAARRRGTGKTPQTARSLGSERGLATPSPDGKGEIPLGPSLKIMPVDSYSTLGRSCEPAFK